MRADATGVREEVGGPGDERGRCGGGERGGGRMRRRGAN
jgi:hypothetical protein